MKSSESLKTKIKEEEGFRAKAYKDGMIKGVQQHSIGYGHQIQPSEMSLLTATITKAKADTLFDADLKVYENAVNKNASRSLNQNQFDALVSFAYNAGAGAVAKVLSTWNASGDSLKTIAHMKEYNKWTVGGVLQVNSGLVARRLRETTLFLSGEVKKKVCTCPSCGFVLNNPCNL